MCAFLCLIGMCGAKQHSITFDWTHNMSHLHPLSSSALWLSLAHDQIHITHQKCTHCPWQDCRPDRYWACKTVPPTSQYHQSHQLPICKKWRLLQPQTENRTTPQIYHSWHFPSSPHVGKHQCTCPRQPPKEVFPRYSSKHNPEKTCSVWTEGLYMSQNAPIDKST